MLPFYLINKLQQLNINSIGELIQIGYLKTFRYLKLMHKSTSYKTLFDLYSICNKIPIGNLTFEQQNYLKTEYQEMPPCYLPIPIDQIKHFLHLANGQAILASKNQEIPIGAVVVKDNHVIAASYNQTITAQNITAHAEIIVLQQAAKIIGSHRLDECDLYVTLEPCLMCSGAIIHSRIRRLIFGANEDKTGAVNSQYKVFNNLNVNHHTETIGPIDQKLYSKTLQDFFKSKR